MGMYDQEVNFGETFSIGDRFVVQGAEFAGEVSTKYGKAQKSILTIVSRSHPQKAVRYTALGEGIARQAKASEPSDFPHVAELIKVPTSNAGNEVKLLAKVDVAPRAFIDGDDGPALTLGDTITTGGVQQDHEGDAVLF